MNYGWSKLGGECAVQMYKNSLVLRVEGLKNLSHISTLFTMLKLVLYHHEVAKILKTN